MNAHVRLCSDYNELFIEDLKPYGTPRTSFSPRRIAEKALGVLARLPLSRPFGLNTISELIELIAAQGPDEYNREHEIQLPSAAGFDLHFIKLDVTATDDQSAETGRPILAAVCDAASGMFVAYYVGFELPSLGALLAALEEKVLSRPYRGTPVDLKLARGGAA